MPDNHTPSHKVCRRCKNLLPWLDFGKLSSNPDGRHFYCRPCRSEYSTAGIQGEKAKERARKAYAADPVKAAKGAAWAAEKARRKAEAAKVKEVHLADKASKKTATKVRAEAQEKVRSAALKLERAARREIREAEKKANLPPAYAPPIEKQCSKCGEVKLLGLFGSHVQTRDGKNSWCRACKNSLGKGYRSTPEGREKRRQHKQLDRRKAGVPPRLHGAHVASYQRHLAALAKAPKLHDAHVRAHRKRQSWKDPKTGREPPGKNHRRRLKLRTGGTERIPPWANSAKIKEIYFAARVLTEQSGIQWDVDHIVPLKHPLVSGLHWEGNLWPVPHDENGRKSNRYWPDMPSAVD